MRIGEKLKVNYVINHIQYINVYYRINSNPRVLYTEGLVVPELCIVNTADISLVNNDVLTILLTDADNESFIAQGSLTMKDGFVLLEEPINDTNIKLDTPITIKGQTNCDHLRIVGILTDNSTFVIADDITIVDDAFEIDYTFLSSQFSIGDEIRIKAFEIGNESLFDFVDVNIALSIEITYPLTGTEFLANQVFSVSGTTDDRYVELYLGSQLYVVPVIGGIFSKTDCFFTSGGTKTIRANCLSQPTSYSEITVEITVPDVKWVTFYSPLDGSKVQVNPSSQLDYMFTISGYSNDTKVNLTFDGDTYVLNVVAGFWQKTNCAFSSTGSKTIRVESFKDATKFEQISLTSKEFAVAVTYPVDGQSIGSGVPLTIRGTTNDASVKVLVGATEYNVTAVNGLWSIPNVVLSEDTDIKAYCFNLQAIHHDISVMAEVLTPTLTLSTPVSANLAVDTDVTFSGLVSGLFEGAIINIMIERGSHLFKIAEAVLTSGTFSVVARVNSGWFLPSNTADIFAKWNTTESNRMTKTLTYDATPQTDSFVESTTFVDSGQEIILEILFTESTSFVDSGGATTQTEEILFTESTAFVDSQLANSIEEILLTESTTFVDITP